MMEVLNFIFQDVRHFVGVIILIAVLGDALHEIFHK